MRTIEDQTNDLRDLAALREHFQQLLTVADDGLRRVNALEARHKAGIHASTLIRVAKQPEPDSAPEVKVQAETAEPPLPEASERTVGRFGPVTYADALRMAEGLGEFDRATFATRLGLTGVDVMRWLDELIAAGEISYIDGRYRALNPPTMKIWVVHHADDESFTVEEAGSATGLAVEEVLDELEALQKEGVVTTVNGSGTWRYVPPPSYLSPREHETKAPPETYKPSYDLAPPNRGVPVRVSAQQRAGRRGRSVEGARGIHGPAARDRRYEQMNNAHDDSKRKKDAKKPTTRRRKTA